MKGRFIAGAVGALAVAAVATGAQAPARAADPLFDVKGIPGTFSANVGLVSEYYFRGLSQTDDAPALQGGMDYEVELAKPVSAYLGVWGSNVDFNEAAGVDGATLELDLYGGLKGKIGNTGLSWTGGLIYYAYPGAGTDLNYDFVEGTVGLGYDFGVAAVDASVNYSPDFFGGSGNAVYYKLGLSVPVLKKVDLGAYVARQTIENNAAYGAPDYWEWNLSASVSVLGFDVGAAYSDTDISGDPDGKGKAVIFSVSRAF